MKRYALKDRSNNLNLDEIEWKDLEHAYGDASDVPGLIHDLGSTDRKVFDAAIYELFGNVWHQGTVYEATVQALPFFLELLRSQSVLDLDPIIVLVASIASGNGYHQIHSATEAVNPFDGSKVKGLANVDELLAAEDIVVRDIRSIMVNEIDLLISFADRPSSDVRTSIFQAFGCYPSEMKRTMPILKAALVNEKDEDILYFINESIEALSDA